MKDQEFWDHVDQSAGPAGCWPWKGGTTSRGYGQSWHGHGRPELAHRRALRITVGEPEDPTHEALHSCDTPPCANPAHLRWGTHEENMADMLARGRARAGRKNVDQCPHGHPMTEDNILHGTKTQKGRTYQTRACRECNRQYLRKRRARRAALTP